MEKIKKFFLGVWLFIGYGPIQIVEWRALAEKAGEWQKQAMHDSLTGLYNRNFLVETGRKALAVAKRSKETELCMLYLDANDFKIVNDTEGHDAGDEVLRSIAKLLKEYFRRESDVVARIGGDEFVVLLYETDFFSAVKLAEKVNSAKVFSPLGKKITLSCGVAEVRPEYSFENFLDAADMAMYTKKQKSKQ